MITLAHCPFCGGNAGFHTRKSNQGTYFAYVQCDGCKSQTRAVPIEDFGDDRDIEFAFWDAGQLWNCRYMGNPNIRYMNRREQNDNRQK